MQVRVQPTLAMTFAFVVAVNCGGNNTPMETGGAGGTAKDGGAAGQGPGVEGGGQAGSQGQGGAAGSGTDGGQCPLEPKGAKFTFHVHNATSSMVTLWLGCGAKLPIVLDTPAGKLSIGPGDVDVCEFTCDQVYAGQVQPQACSDCGPGYSKPIAAGATADIEWERRVYEAQMVRPPCSPSGTGSCAYGRSVAPTRTQAGVVTTCTGSVPMGVGGCPQPKMTSFTLDTTAGEGTIEVM
jgi:hypothetical protein